MQNQSKAIALTVLAAILVGVLVIVFNSDYRIEKIIETNRRYIPMVTISGN